jgi:hypothetical protein
MDQAGLVVGGGGIARASLAYALASAGRDVVVLEASVAFEDRVRGEQMHAWGVKELGTWALSRSCWTGEPTSLVCGGSTSRARPGRRRTPVSMMVPGVQGTLNMRHPDACQALLDELAPAPM